MPKPQPRLTEQDKIRASTVGLIYLANNMTADKAFDFLHSFQPEALNQLGTKAAPENLDSSLDELLKLSPEFAGHRPKLRAFLLELHEIAKRRKTDRGAVQ